ncbi:MAG: DNA polymerase III subunit gamma/tau [Chloroflexota bacterium]
MPAVSLYRKWRPQTFAAVIGQDHITTTLQNAIRGHRIAHAYLFTGPRGTGKTTTARIFAKAVSCLHDDETARPCNQCAVCLSVNEGRDLDLIEIDAASNNSVDNVRDLRERVGFLPNQSRYKVYIIDEVHMLSTSAFNALLKTLEEPPAHAIFILATTEVDKLPATILSRCQRFDFRFVSFRQLREQLAMIAIAEGAQIEAGALDLFARQAGGSMRDGISLLDQMIAYGDGAVTLKQAQTILGSVASQAVGQLASQIIARDVGGGLNLINDAIANGADPRQFVREVLEYLRGLLLLRGSPDGGLLNLPAETVAEMKAQTMTLPTAELLFVIKSFSQAVNQLRNAPQPQLPIEVAFVESALRQGTNDKGQVTGDATPTTADSVRMTPPPATKPVAPPPPPRPSDQATTRPTPPATRPPTPPPSPRPTASATKPATAPATNQPTNQPTPTKKPTPTTQPPNHPTTSSSNAQLDTLQGKWNDVLAAVKAQNRSLEAILKAGRAVTLDGDIVVLGFPYDFHKDKADEPKNKQLLEEVLGAMFNAPLRVRCEIVKGDAKRTPLRPKDKNQVAMEDPLVKEIVTKYNARIAGVEDEPMDEGNNR